MVPRAVVLASASPQRRRILEDLGVAFTVRPADVEERTAGDPRAVAAENARRKALAVEGELVIGCDTLVATEDAIWGKPADLEAARATLRRLAGTTHEVVSGLAVVVGGALREALEVTRVSFRGLDDAAIDRYLGTGEWRGRAGGYAVQGVGATLVSRLEGDFLNVVGLPAAALVALAPEVLQTPG